MYPDPSTVLPQNADPTNASANNPSAIFGLSNLPTTLNAQQVRDFQKMTIPSQAPTDLTAQIMGFNQPIQQLQTTQKEQETGQSQTQNAILGLMNQLSGQSQFQAQAEEQAGLPTLNKGLLDLQNLQRQQTLSYLQGLQNIEGKPIAMEFITGQQEQLNRQRAIDAMATSAQLQAMQGNISLAQDTVKRMVDAKYDPIIRNIETAKFILEQQGSNLSRTDKKLLEAKTAQAEAIKAKKAEENATGKLIVDATPNAPADVIAKAQELFKNGASGVEVAIALGKYGGDYLGDLVKRSTISKNEADIRKSDADYEKTMKEIKAMGQVPQITAPTGTNANFIQNLAASAVNKESLVANEREKITKSFAVTQQLGALAQNLQRDQTNFAGGKVKEIMAYLGQDKDAGLIQAQITALVPQVARGIFGEVGVLTNQDTQNYKKVIGNLTSPNDQNKAVTAMTLTALRNGVKSQLEVAAASKLDVSRFAPLYQDLTNQINKINDEIGYSDVQVKEYADLNPQLKPMIEQLIIDGRKGSEILQIIGVEN